MAVYLYIYILNYCSMPDLYKYCMFALSLWKFHSPTPEPYVENIDAMEGSRMPMHLHGKILQVQGGNH